MRKYGLIWLLLTFWLLPGLACGLVPGLEQTATLVETDACCLQEPDVNATLAAAQQGEETALHTSTPTAPARTATPAAPPAPTHDAPAAAHGSGDLLRQGARFGSLAPYALEDIAVGDYQADYPACGEAYLSQLPEESGELVLTLTYFTPVLPEQVEIYGGGQAQGIARVELMNSLSGLGKVIYQNGGAFQRAPLAEGACPERLIFPADTDFEVDTILIAFQNLDTAARISAVELLGRLEGYADVPVFWRVPLANTPVDLAMAHNGLLYVATQPDGLFTYDVEGNQLKQFSSPDAAQLNGVAADLFGNLVVADAGFGWFIVLSPEGEQLAVGGSESYYQAAVSPLDGNLYLLSAGGIAVFTTDTAELVRQLPLDAQHSYAGLAFDPQGRLYTLRDHNWSPTLLMLDPISGEELDAVLLIRASLGEIIARDLAIDEHGNIYVLFSINTGQIAVHMLAPGGLLTRRFGILSGDPYDWPEGSFFDPRAIAVSPDGRFILIADGFESASFLTAFRLEAD